MKWWLWWTVYNYNGGLRAAITYDDYNWITITTTMAWDAPSPSIYTSWRRARGWPHIQAAYAASLFESADELGEAVAEQAAAATTDLPLPAYHLLLLCLCHACTWKWLMAHCLLCIDPVRQHALAMQPCGGGEAFASPFRPLCCCCCCHIIAGNWFDIKGDLSRKSLRPSLRLSLAAATAAEAATAMFQDLGTRDYTTTSIHTYIELLLI